MTPSEQLGQHYSFEVFMATRILVGSRNFGISVDGESVSAMVPLADLLNHHSLSQNTDWGYTQLEQLNGHFRLVTTTSLPAGEIFVRQLRAG